jgi:hypothetical protein
MVTFRITAKLSKAAKLPLQSGASAGSSGELGDWFATLVRVQSGNYILAMSGVTLLPVVMRGRDAHNFATRFPADLAALLTALHVPKARITRECAHYAAPVAYAATADRSTMGVLNDMVRMFTYEIADEGVPLTYVSLRLACTPMVSRNLFPNRATCKMFGAPEPSDVMPWSWRNRT